MVAHTGRDLPVPVLANSSYGDSLWHMKKDLDDMPNFSVYRFALAAKMIKEYQENAKKPIIDYAFDILDAVNMQPQNGVLSMISET